MKKGLLLVLLMCLSGCVTLPADQDSTVRANRDQKRSAGPTALTPINRVYVGMAYQEVIGIMGDRLTVGYEMVDGRPKRIFLKSPYRVETLKDGRKHYQILYYYTGVHKADGMVDEEELTPLVFEENRLIGKGRDFLFKLKDTL